MVSSSKMRVLYHVSISISISIFFNIYIYIYKHRDICIHICHYVYWSLCHLIQWININTWIYNRQIQPRGRARSRALGFRV